MKGVRLDAVVRFQFLADELDNVEVAVEALQSRLLDAKDALWKAGFLRFGVKETSLAERLPIPNIWRKTVDYEVLFEFHYQDTDGAESIIARIPIDIDSEYGEGLGAVIRERVAELGRRLVVDRTFTPGALESREIADEIALMEPDVVVLVSYAPEFRRILREIKSAGWEVPVLGSPARQDRLLRPENPAGTPGGMADHENEGGDVAGDALRAG